MKKNANQENDARAEDLRQVQGEGVSTTAALNETGDGDCQSKTGRRGGRRLKDFPEKKIFCQKKKK